MKALVYNFRGDLIATFVKDENEVETISHNDGRLLIAYKNGAMKWYQGFQYIIEVEAKKAE